MCRLQFAERSVANKNICAFLDMIAYSELGNKILDESDDGYNVLVGSVPGHVDLFSNYSHHPRKVIHIPRLNLWSSAAGRYQFIWPTWKDLIATMKFTDFSPVTQDKGAIELIKEVNALEDVMNGKFADAVRACRHIWASLPGAGYGQHENKLQELTDVYTTHGGTV